MRISIRKQSRNICWQDPHIPRYMLWLDGKISVGKYDDSGLFTTYWSADNSLRQVSASPWLDENVNALTSDMEVFGKCIEPVSGFYDGGAWFIGVHKLMDGRLAGFFHAESHWPGVSAAYKSIGVTYSSDNGLTWETATTTDVGLDFGMLNKRLQFNGDYYIRKTTDMYTVGETLPDVFGASSPKGNYADMTTKGWEITLTWRDQFTLAEKPFNYEIRGTLSDYISTIYAGKRVGEIWGYVTEGLFKDQADIDSHADQTLIQSSSKRITYPGDVKIKDLNGDHVIDYGNNTVDDHGDKTVIGNALPRYAYSINLSGDWNNFFLSAFFQGVGKQDWYPSSECIFWGQYNRPYNNMPTWHQGNYWTEDNTDAYLPRYAGYNASLKSTPQTRYLQNVAYIRLKNLQFGYTLPQPIVSKAKLQNVRVYISAENLWCWSPLYKHTRDLDVTNIYGSDPDLTDADMSSGLNGNRGSGDGNSYPQMKSVSLGLSVTF